VLDPYNAALEWQATSIERSKNLEAACPLEGLVRLILKGDESQYLPSYH
jgi:hypothetical protein